jgi:hypothetical protein
MPMICCSESSTEFFEIINYIQAFMKIAPQENPGEHILYLSKRGSHFQFLCKRKS